MAGLIPQTFIDDLLDRIDIVDVINSRVPLKKAGKSHKACCPFHEEKTPSFTVAQDKQFYHCFGCGAGGNALSFVMAFDRLDFVPAVELLAKNAGLEIPREVAPNPSVKKHRDNLYTVVEEADRFYRKQLRTPEAAGAVNYLKSRGLTGEIAAKFGLGYAPQGWDNLIKAMGGDDHKLRLLDESGMLVTKPEEKKQYDRFRHRIIFPIRDQRGRTLGFGGRVLDNSTPKYLNSPETPDLSQRQRALRPFRGSSGTARNSLSADGRGLYGCDSPGAIWHPQCSGYSGHGVDRKPSTKAIQIH
jgi:DNA primase